MLWKDSCYYFPAETDSVGMGVGGLAPTTPGGEEFCAQFLSLPTNTDKPAPK